MPIKRTELDHIVKEINRHPLTHYFELIPSQGNMYCCPICHSGEGPHRTGALKLYLDSNRVKCFANNCFTDKGEDTLGALCLIWGKNTIGVIEKLGYTVTNYTKSTRRESKSQAKQMLNTLIPANQRATGCDTV